MGRSTSSKTVIIIFLYFVVLFSFMFVGQSFANEYGLSMDNVSSSGGGISTNFTFGYCGGVRFDGQGTGSVEASLLPAPLIEFDYITDQASCLEYEGFEWNSKFNIWTLSTIEFCDGKLNHTFYNIGGSQNFSTDWGGNYLQPEGFFASPTPLSQLHVIRNDKNTCELMGFNWIREYQNNLEIEPNSGTVTSMWGIIKESLSFQLEFSTSVPLVNVLLTLLLIWIPLMIMAFNIFIMLPFVGGD